MTLPKLKEETTHAVSIATLSLSHFRNYSQVRIETGTQPVVLTGRNGMGKTNVLEALSLLLPGRGLRRAKIAELDSKQGGGLPWAVATTLRGIQGEVRIGTGRDLEASEETDRRMLKIDGRVQRGQGELASHVAMSWLTPQMEQLFHEGSSASRKFLDRLVFVFDAGHSTRVNAYDAAMRERNKLLAAPGADRYWLSSLEQTMAENAASIAASRLHAAEHLDHAIAISPPKRPLNRHWKRAEMPMPQRAEHSPEPIAASCP